jgi:hypothetical protein
MKNEDYNEEDNQDFFQHEVHFKNETCPHCHQKRVLEGGLLRCKKCNNGDAPVSFED